MRELKEEIGTNRAEMIAESQNNRLVRSETLAVTYRSRANGKCCRAALVAYPIG